MNRWPPAAWAATRGAAAPLRPCRSGVSRKGVLAVSMPATASPSSPGHLTTTRSSAHRISVHGLAVSIRNHLPSLDAPLRRAVGEFAVGSFPAGFTTTEGTLRHYDKQ